MRLIITERRAEADGVLTLSLESTDGRALPTWTPGAHVDLFLADGIVRQYSLCSDPENRRRWRLGILHEPNSRGGSRHVFDKLHTGDIVTTGEPRNHFPLRPAPRYVFIAGGIGITPILPMLVQAERAGAQWTLRYGGRGRRSMAFTGELTRFGDRVTIAPQDETGLLDLAGALETPLAETLVYACGPEPMLTAVADRMRNWPPDSLRIERFTPREVESVRPHEPFEVEFRRSGITTTVGADESILTAAENAGVIVDWSCREGTCGTCETPLLDGRAEHHDSVLTASERGAQDCLMICVSRAERGCALLRLDL